MTLPTVQSIDADLTALEARIKAPEPLSVDEIMALVVALDQLNDVTEHLARERRHVRSLRLDLDQKLADIATHLGGEVERLKAVPHVPSDYNIPVAQFPGVPAAVRRGRPPKNAAALSPLQANGLPENPSLLDVCGALGVSKTVIRKWTAEDGFPMKKAKGGRLVIKKEKLIEWLGRRNGI